MGKAGTMLLPAWVEGGEKRGGESDAFPSPFRPFDRKSYPFSVKVFRFPKAFFCFIMI